VQAELRQPVRTKLPTIHYGWVILGAGTFGSFMTLPGQTAGVSVFFDPITTELGISRTSASIAYAAGTLAGILPAPAIGRWIDRLGPRPTATIIAGGLALACVHGVRSVRAHAADRAPRRRQIRRRFRLR
jgi:MFS family permease